MAVLGAVFALAWTRSTGDQAGSPVAVLFVVLGGAVFVTGVVSFVVRAVALVVGIRLFLSGRRGLREHPTENTDGLTARLVAAWSGGTAAPDAGGVLGAAALVDGPAVRPDAAGWAVAPAPGAAPGWYDDPSGGRRWWDGAAWGPRARY